MNKVLWKDNLIEIKKSWARFLSILLIMLLGVAFFVGIRATSPSMIETARRYYEQYDLPDGQILSTLGLEQADVDVLLQEDLIVDALKTVETSLSPLNARVKVYAYTNQAYFYAVQGQLPNQAGEIALDIRFKEEGLKIGDQIELEQQRLSKVVEGERSPYLRQTTYRVVGFVDSSLYYSKVTRGVTNIDGFVLINNQDIEGDLYTEILYWVPQASKYRAYSKEYDMLMNQVNEVLEQRYEKRPDIRLTTLKDKLQNAIDDGVVDINEGYHELIAAKQKLLEAEHELEDGRQQYRVGLSDLATGKKEYDAAVAKVIDGESSYQSGIVELATQTDHLIKAEQDYQNGIMQTQNGQQLFEQELVSARQQLATSNQQLIALQNLLQQSKNQFESGLAALLEGEAQLMTQQATLLSELESAIPNLDQELNILKEQAQKDLLDVQTKEEILSTFTTEPELTLIYLQEQLKNVMTTKSTLQRNIDTAPEQLNIVNMDLEEVALSLSLLYENQTMLEKNIAELTGQLANINEQYGIQEQQEAILTAGNTELQAEIDTIQSQLADLSADDMLYIELAERFVMLQEQLAQNEQELSEVIREKMVLAEQLNQLNAQLESLSIQQSEITTQIASLVSQQQMLQAQKVELEYLLSVEARNQLVDLTTNEMNLAQQVSNLTQAIEQLTVSRLQLTTSRQQLVLGQQTYNEGLVAYQQGLADYQAGQSALINRQTIVQQELEQAWAELSTGRSLLDDGWLQYQQGEQRLLNAFDELRQGRESLIVVQQVIASSEVQLATALQLLEKGEAEYNGNRQKFLVEESKARSELSEAERELDDARANLNKLTAPIYFMNLRDSFDSYDSLYDNANQIYQISLVFPVFFFAIAILVTFTTVKRMVSEQRNYMGTMKQMGYSNVAILSKFVFYALVATLMGAFIGIEIGYRLFPNIIMNAYNNLFHFDTPTIVRSNQLNVIVTIIALLCALIPSVWTPLRILRAKPAQLLQPEAPKAGKKILFEQIHFIWQRLSFNRKMTIRNLLRYKGRNLMTLLGVAGCTMLIVTGFGISDTIADLVGTQFEQLQTYNAAAYLDENVAVDQVEQINESLINIDNINQVLPIETDTWQTNTEKAVQSVSIVVPLADYKDFLNIHQRSLPDKTIELATLDGVVISERLAEYVKVQVGENLVLTKDGRKISLPVKAINENYIEHYVYLSPANYKKYFNKTAVANSFYLKYDGKVSKGPIEEDVMSISNIATIISLIVVQNKVEKIMGSLNMITIVLIISAAALAFVVLYNLTNINVSERLRELSTIKVLGFYNREVSLYIYDEILIVTIIGSIMGMGLGTLLNKYILKTIQMPNLFFYPQVEWQSYFISAIMTFIFSSIVMLVMHRKLKRIDMVEALKAVE